MAGVEPPLATDCQMALAAQSIATKIGVYALLQRQASIGDALEMSFWDDLFVSSRVAYATATGDVVKLCSEA
jgi:hypothetical protein